MSSEHSPRAKVYKWSNESSSYMKQKVSLPNKLPISAVKKSPCNISYTSYSLNVMNNNIFLKSMWYSDVARKVDNTFLFLSFFLSLFLFYRTNIPKLWKQHINFKKVNNKNYRVPLLFTVYRKVFGSESLKYTLLPVKLYVLHHVIFIFTVYVPKEATSSLLTVYDPPC